MLYSMKYNSIIGELLLIEKDDFLIGVWMMNQKYFLGSENKSEEIIEKETKVLLQTKNWLDRYFNNEKPSINELPIAFIGTEFRKEVWEILAEIPYGEVITYGEIARKIAKKRKIDRMSSQAVGGAVGHNPFTIIIPCHRVVGNNGNLTGYAGGLDKKIKLLTHEGLDMSKFFVPSKGTAL